MRAILARCRYSRLNYGGYGGYSSYGNYGSYGGYGYGGAESGPLSRLAEESTRGAFESVESVVHAFGSVSLMLESTYAALQSSFRAVVGVADQFARLRGHLAQTLSALALVRTLRWMVRAILALLGKLLCQLMEATHYKHG